MPLSWRRANRAVHRDLGYLCAGLTILYAVTGVLLNHLHDWNPHWERVPLAARVAPPPPAGSFGEGDLARILAELGEREKPAGTFFRSPETLQIFFEGGRVLNVDVPTGKVTGEAVRERRTLAFLDALHLNRAGRAWGWLADLYAAALALLALTGLFVLKGRNGITRRGAVLAAAGLAVPGLLLLLAR